MGNAVDSVVFITNAGEKITIDKTADLYETLEKVDPVVEFENGKK